MWIEFYSALFEKWFFSWSSKLIYKKVYIKEKVLFKKIKLLFKFGKYTKKSWWEY